MKLLLLKILFKRRARDEGMVIPVVIAFGLIMALLGTFSIVQSSEENLGAITDNSNAKALAAAEAGISRYLDLITNNRKIAMYDYSLNKTTPSSTVNNWITPPDLCDTDTEITNAVTGFNDVVDSTSTYDNLGQYRLISYEYLDNNNNTVANGTAPDDTTKGRLKVEGRSSANDSGARTIQVDIPVRRDDPDLSDLDPALWINSPTVTNIGGDNLEVGNDIDNDGDFEDTISGVTEFSSSIVFSNPAVGTTTGCNFPTGDFTNVNTEKILSVPYNVPNTPSDPVNRINITDAQLEALITNGGQLPSGFGFPLSNARDSSNFYHYYVDATSLDGLVIDGNLPVQAGRKIILYVCGDITFTSSAGTAINVNSNDPSNLEIYGNNATTSYTDGAGNACTDNTPTITFSGTGTINVNAFIHSPGATVTTADSPTVNLTGALWVDDWNDTTLSSQITITPFRETVTVGGVTSVISSYEAYTSRQNMNPIPTIGAATDWKIVETN